MCWPCAAARTGDRARQHRRLARLLGCARAGGRLLAAGSDRTGRTTVNICSGVPHSLREILAMAQSRRVTGSRSGSTRPSCAPTRSRRSPAIRHCCTRCCRLPDAAARRDNRLDAGRPNAGFRRLMPMPNSYVPVSPERHRSMRWQRFNSFAFARETQRRYRIAGDAEALHGQSDPVQDGRRASGAMRAARPRARTERLSLTRFPLAHLLYACPPAGAAIPARAAGADQYELQVDTSHVSPDTGEPFFSEDNTPAPPLKAVLEFLQQWRLVAAMRGSSPTSSRRRGRQAIRHRRH